MYNCSLFFWNMFLEDKFLPGAMNGLVSGRVEYASHESHTGWVIGHSFLNCGSQSMGRDMGGHEKSSNTVKGFWIYSNQNLIQNVTNSRLFLAVLTGVALWVHCSLGSEHTPRTFYSVPFTTRTTNDWLTYLASDFRLWHDLSYSVFTIYTKISALREI